MAELLALFITRNSEYPACPSTIGSGMMRTLGKSDITPVREELQRLLTRR
jgi:hypothetical protein